MRSRRRCAAGRTGLALLVALVAAAASCSGDDDATGAGTTTTTTSRPTTSTTEALPTIVSLDDAAAQTIDVTPDVDWITVADGTAWVAGVGGGIRRYDALTGAELGTTPVSGVICLAMEVGFGSLWAGTCETNTVVRVDLATGVVQAVIDPGIGPLANEASIAVDDAGVYVMSNGVDRTVAHIDPATNGIAGTFTAPPSSLAVRGGFGSLWFTQLYGDIARVRSADGAIVGSERVGAGARFLAVGSDAVWVMASGDRTVVRVAPDGKVVATIRVAQQRINGGDIAVGGGYVWARVSDAVVVQIDETTNEVVARYGMPSGSGGVGATDGVVWLSAHDIATIWRVPVT